MNAARTTPNNRPENNTPAGDATRADQDAADPRHMAKAAATVLHSTGTSIGEGVGASIAKTASTRANAIRDLNDAFRAGRASGRMMMTSGIANLPPAMQLAILMRVRAFDAFTPDNDPYGEHDYGSFTIAGHVVIWKIDAYDSDLEHGSPDASDPAVTTRVLTIMLAEEY